MSTDTHASRSASSPNRLLARLPADDYQRLLPHLETTRLSDKQALLTPHVRAQKIYFLGGGVCSITQVTAEGQMAGVAMVGNEGVVGIHSHDGRLDSTARSPWVQPGFRRT